jgi:hypothetical protein
VSVNNATEKLAETLFISLCHDLILYIHTYIILYLLYYL